MADLAASDASVTGAGRLKIDAAMLALGFALAVTTLLKLTVYARQPLSIDEVWTGMIASQSSVAGLIRECQRDVNGPLGYIISWVWAQIAGLSNGALRAPSIIFACVAPWLALTPHRLANRTVRYVWAVLLACWMPGLVFAEQARCYALVLVLATANAVTYAHLIRRPSLSTAFVWTSISALFILSHYVAGLLVACQGFAYLAIHRGKAFKTWPAALVFAPAFACMAFQAVSLMAFARPATAVLPPMSVSDLLPTAGLILGGSIVWPVIVIWVGIGLIAGRRSRLERPATAGSDAQKALVWTAVTALLAACICLAIGLARPIVSPRFMTIFVPGVMLGLALMADNFGQVWRRAPVVLGVVFLGLALAFSAITLFISPPSAGAMFSFEPAGQALMATGPRRLVFFWDNPATSASESEQLAQIGGFLFKRAGRPIPVEVVRWARGADPNALLLSTARSPGDAILWIYDRHVTGALVLNHRPAIERQDRAWACHDYGDNNVGIIACHGRAKA
jgi:uncharacterized membrane protein